MEGGTKAEGGGRQTEIIKSTRDKDANMKKKKLEENYTDTLTSQI